MELVQRSLWIGLSTLNCLKSTREKKVPRHAHSALSQSCKPKFTLGLGIFPLLQKNIWNNKFKGRKCFFYPTVSKVSVRGWLSPLLWGPWQEVHHGETHSRQSCLPATVRKQRAKEEGAAFPVTFSTACPPYPFSLAPTFVKFHLSQQPHSLVTKPFNPWAPGSASKSRPTSFLSTQFVTLGSKKSALRTHCPLHLMTQLLSSAL